MSTSTQSTKSSATSATTPTCTNQSQNPGDPVVYSFFENNTSTWQYVVSDPKTKQAVIIDPVLDFSPASGQISTTTADGLISFAKEHGLQVTMLLETHAHADHLTGAQYLKQKLGGIPVCIGKRISQVQERFGKVYGIPKEQMEGAFDKYWDDGETFDIGDLKCEVIHLPGHTPDHVGYQCGKTLFVGDTLFYPDVGSARADFPGGSPTDLYNSITRILSFDPDLRIFAGHDYPPEGGKPRDSCWSSVAEQREQNVHLQGRLAEFSAASSEGSKDMMNKVDSFIRWRAQRDQSLGAPRLLHPSLQVNICAGKLPSVDQFGRRMIKIPLKVPEGL